MPKGQEDYGSSTNLVNNMAVEEDQEEEKTKGKRGKMVLSKAGSLARQGSIMNEHQDTKRKAGSALSPMAERVLTPDEKAFLLCVERGDVATAKGIIEAMAKRPNLFSINCMDPLGRNGLIIGVENENYELMEMLVEQGIQLKDSLLVAIREEYVEGAEFLLKHEEDTHVEGQPYSWESMDIAMANFTADVTPLILAAHKNNFEILKMLLDRGATVPIPHDVKCSCEECVRASTDDSLRFSLARINAYRALASPSLIALSSKDPIITAFQLSDELKRLAKAESQYKDEYVKLRAQVQEFVTALIDHTRTSYELEVLLNHNPDGEVWQVGDIQPLARLKLAIDYKQKSFVAHPSVQQLLASIWYEGLPGFRRKHIARQVLECVKLCCSFPINSLIYIMAPGSGMGRFMRNPFVKFISHSASYMCFLMLLALASQRFEHVLLSIVLFVFPDITFLAELQADWIQYERGCIPKPIELLIIVWVQGLCWEELKALWKEGLIGYISQMWNIADIFILSSFMGWIGLRGLAFLIVQKEVWEGVPPEVIWPPREQWGTFAPQNLADATFGAGMIASYLKLTHMLSINPYLGPLQIALGKMIIDIVKWMFLFLLVVFSFGCGMNQLLWYYSDLERQVCYSLPGGLPDFDNEPDSCTTWRRFANLWETSQSLFWASFGLVDLGDFDLKGIGGFTRFAGLLMFGSYSVCNIIVLLNMLIAMMSNSYQVISDRSDVEWKFSRSKLWISYFENGSTVPVPFNLIPSPKSILKTLLCRKAVKKDTTEEEQEAQSTRYNNVVKYIIIRYITSEQRKSEDFSITEDDIQEVRQDISSFKYELLDILKSNNMRVPDMKRDVGKAGKKSKNMERQIQKGFQISKIEGVAQACFAKGNKPKDLFKHLARMVGKKDEKKDSTSMERVRRATLRRDPIGSTATSIKRSRDSLKRSLLTRGATQEEIKVSLVRLNSEELVAYNPMLSEHTATTGRAYARFKDKLLKSKAAGRLKQEPAREDKAEGQAEVLAGQLELHLEAACRETGTPYQGVAPEPQEVSVHPAPVAAAPVADTPAAAEAAVVEPHLEPQPPKLTSASGPDQEKAPEAPQAANNISPPTPATQLPVNTTDTISQVKPEPANSGEPGGVDNAGFVPDEDSPHGPSQSRPDIQPDTPQLPEGVALPEGLAMDKEPEKKKDSEAQQKTPKLPDTKKAKPEEEYEFDVEGKSVLSGKKRTGWM